MKPITLFIALSLAANAALGILLFRTPAISAKQVPSSEGTAAANTSKSSRPHTASEAPLPKLWPRLECENLQELKQRLTNAGFNSREVRTMLLALWGLRMETKREQIMGRREDVPYWQDEYALYRDPKIQKQLMELDAGESEGFRKLLKSANNLAEDPDAQANAKRRYGDLPVDKLQRLSDLETDFQERQMKMYRDAMQAGNRVEMSPEQRTAMAQLEKERHDAIAAQLTPDELQQYDLRNSSTANRLRYQLGAFQASEEEFKAIYKAYAAIDQQYLTGQQKDESQAKAYAEARNQVDAQLETVLGPDRYADFKASFASPNDKLSLLVTRLNLPARTITTVNDLRSDITQRAQAVRTNTQLSQADRTVQLAALAQEAQQKLTDTLGTSGYTAYEDMKGDWIRALTKTK